MSTPNVSRSPNPTAEGDELDYSNDQIDEFLDTFYFEDEDYLELEELSDTEESSTPTLCSEGDDDEDEDLYDMYGDDSEEPPKTASTLSLKRPTISVKTAFVSDYYDPPSSPSSPTSQDETTLGSCSESEVEIQFSETTRDGVKTNGLVHS